MKVKSAPLKSKTFKKSVSGTIQKKKFSKPTSGVLKNVVKITDAFEDLKSGNDLTGISCSKEPKPVKKISTKAKIPKDSMKLQGFKGPKNSIDLKKDSKKTPVAQKQKKPKKETIDGASKSSLKSKTHETCLATKYDDREPKLDIDKVNYC